MNKKIYIALIIIAIFTLIAAGCGGGDGITQSVTSPGFVNTENTQTGSITIKVKWPEIEIAESNELTANMPVYTRKVKITIFEAGTENSVRDVDLYREEGDTVIIETIDLIPVILVDIKAQAYDRNDNPIEGAEAEQKDIQIYAGSNAPVDLSIGEHHIYLTSEISEFSIIPDFESDTLKCIDEIELIARLSISPPSQNLEGYELTFKILSGDNVYFLEEEATGKPLEITSITDEDGKATATLKADENIEVDEEIKIQAYYIVENPFITDDYIEGATSNELTIKASSPQMLQEDFEVDVWGNPITAESILYFHSMFNNRTYWNTTKDFDAHTTNCGVVKTGGAYGSSQAAKLKSDTDLFPHAYDAYDGYNCEMEFRRNLPEMVINGEVSSYFPKKNVEYRFYIKLEDEILETSEKVPERIRGAVAIGFYNSGSGVAPNFYKIIFKDEGKEIVGYNGLNLGNYEYFEWIFVKIQITESNQVIYWIGDSPTSNTKYTTTLENEMTDTIFQLSTFGGTVWYDELEVYDLSELPAISE